VGESISNDSAQKFPLGLKIAIAYMLFSGAYGIVWVLIQAMINPADVAVPEDIMPDQDKAGYITGYQIGYAMRTYWLGILFNVIFLLSGIALVRRKAWGRILGLWVLVISTSLVAWAGAVGFAQGYAGTMPTLAMYVGSLTLWSCWHGMCFAMLYRRTTVLVLKGADTNAFTHNTVNIAFMKEQEMEYAGFWVRVGATIIDTLLIMAVTFPLLVSIYGWGYFDAEQTGFIAGPADFLISWVLPAIVVIVFWIQKQATPAKMVLSLRIVDATTGNKPSAGQCVGRYFAYFASTLPLCLGFIWVAFDNRKQGWHDKLAGTVVVRLKNSGSKPVRFVKA